MDPNDEKPATTQGPQDPSQEHPPQDAHGGSMAPDLVDDTGHPKPPDDEKPARTRAGDEDR